MLKLLSTTRFSLCVGDRTNVASTDLSDVLPEEVEAEVKLAVEISMGTEVSEEDISNIMHLCDQVCIAFASPRVCSQSDHLDLCVLSMLLFVFVFFKQVIEISEYRTQLYDYLKNRMMAIAPNLTVMVGELVGARLISHAGESLCFPYT